MRQNLCKECKRNSPLCCWRRHLVWLTRLSRPSAAAILSRKLLTLSRFGRSLPVLFILRTLDAIISDVSDDILISEVFSVCLFNRLYVGTTRDACGAVCWRESIFMRASLKAWVSSSLSSHSRRTVSWSMLIWKQNTGISIAQSHDSNKSRQQSRIFVGVNNYIRYLDILMKDHLFRKTFCQKVMPKVNLPKDNFAEDTFAEQIVSVTDGQFLSNAHFDEPTFRLYF